MKVFDNMVHCCLRLVIKDNHNFLSEILLALTLFIHVCKDGPRTRLCYTPCASQMWSMLLSSEWGGGVCSRSSSLMGHSHFLQMKAVWEGCEVSVSILYLYLMSIYPFQKDKGSMKCKSKMVSQGWFLLFL